MKPKTFIDAKQRDLIRLRLVFGFSVPSVFIVIIIINKDYLNRVYVLTLYTLHTCLITFSASS